jgi:anti-sigma B factor antagonist
LAGHPATEIFLRKLNRKMEVVPVALAGSGRRGLVRGPNGNKLSYPLSMRSRSFLPAAILPQPFPARSGYTSHAVRKVVPVSFSVKIRHRDQVALIDVSGHLTFFEVGALRESIQSLLQAKRKNIVVNLSGLVYLDSSGIGELARIYVAVVKQGGAMKVIGLTPKVEEVLKITHLSQVFQEFPDEQSALRSFPAIS